MSLFDHQYQELISKIEHEGVSNEGKEIRPRWHDGTPAYTTELLHQSFTFTADEVPLLTQKKVPVKSSYAEIRAFWQLKTNKAEDFHKLGIKYWDDWVMENGTIGEAYGAQFAKENIWLNDPQAPGFVDQVNYILWNLKHNPDSRRLITEIWIPGDLHKMALTPCVHLTQWIVQNGKLFLNIRCR